jgi:hypothetical protein
VQRHQTTFVPFASRVLTHGIPLMTVSGLRKGSRATQDRVTKKSTRRRQSLQSDGKDTLVPRLATVSVFFLETGAEAAYRLTLESPSICRSDSSGEAMSSLFGVVVTIVNFCILLRVSG